MGSRQVGMGGLLKKAKLYLKGWKGGAPMGAEGAGGLNLRRVEGGEVLG